MQEVLLVIHLIVAVALIIVILVQPSEAGGFVAASASNLMAPRRTADIMTRTTTILAGIFFITSMALAIVANHHKPAQSILDVDANTPAIGKDAPPANDGSAQSPAIPKAPDAK